MLVYFMGIWPILHPFDIFYGNLIYFWPFDIFLAIWYILWQFGIFRGNLVHFPPCW
jgi:hypothetical protein